jgi:hypothetical protein
VFNNVKVEETKGRGYTKGSEYEELIRLDPKQQKIIESASLEFIVCPPKCQEILLENAIIDHSPEHFARFLYTQPINLQKKTEYMFNSKDDFALKVKAKFVECFSLFDIRIKDFLLLILQKVSPPSDDDQREALYKFFCNEYANQNPDKMCCGDDVEVIIKSIFQMIFRHNK